MTIEEYRIEVVKRVSSDIIEMGGRNAYPQEEKDHIDARLHVAGGILIFSWSRDYIGVERISLNLFRSGAHVALGDTFEEVERSWVVMKGVIQMAVGWENR